MFAQKLATNVFRLCAASEIQEWEREHHRDHPMNPREGRWDDTLPEAPAWFADQAQRYIVDTLLAREGCADVEALAAKFPDWHKGEDLDAFAWNLANWCTGDGAANWRDEAPVGGSLWGYPMLTVTETSVEAYSALLEVGG